MYVYASFIAVCALCNLRCTAFCLEYCWESNIDEAKKPNHVKICAKDTLYESLLNFLLYQFYFPSLNYGPIVNCNTFLNQVRIMRSDMVAVTILNVELPNK